MPPRFFKEGVFLVRCKGKSFMANFHIFLGEALFIIREKNI